MGKQDGLIKIKGQMGGISFYKSKDGYMARQKGGVSAERIRTDPAFERIRENGAEFGRAGKAGKVLRTALRALLINAADGRMVSRLTQQLVRVIQADALNLRGKRNVMDGETELLTGFEFNAEAPLSSVFLAPFESVIDRAAGTLQITFRDFVPNVMIKAPQGATSFRIITAGATINFEDQTYTVDQQQSPVRDLTPLMLVVEPIINRVPVNSTGPMFLVMGVEFYQTVNGSLYPLKNGSTNPLAIIKVDGGA